MNQEEHTILISKSKTKMLKSSLCDYSDAYILVKGTITAAADANAINTNKNGNILTLCSIY